MMRVCFYWLLGTASVIAVLAQFTAFEQPLQSGTVHELPSLTGWGKIFSLLLLATLGVAYIVWRRPVVEAKAILETSPLGSPQSSTTLVDWRLFLKALVVFELLGLGAVWVTGRYVRPLSDLDALGILTSACIISFVAHLLILARRSGHR